MGLVAGRNERCPCGSGLKFKKCCLDANLGAGTVPLGVDSSAQLESQLRQATDALEAREQIAKLSSAVAEGRSPPLLACDELLWFNALLGEVLGRVHQRWPVAQQDERKTLARELYQQVASASDPELIESMTARLRRLSVSADEPEAARGFYREVLTCLASSPERLLGAIFLLRAPTVAALRSPLEEGIDLLQPRTSESLEPYRQQLEEVGEVQAALRIARLQQWLARSALKEA